MLALGLDQQQSNAFLPMKVKMANREHIATWFAPLAAGSLLAGVGPADVHNPAPRRLPLLVGDAAVGNGVLGKAKQANVVFCQLPPYNVTSYPTTQHNLKRTYRRTSFLLSRLLANMGVAGSTPLLERFATPVGGSPAASVVKNGDFSVDADGDGMADQWAFSAGSKEAVCRREKRGDDGKGWSLAITCPPAQGKARQSMMLAQHDVPVRKGQWYRISLRARAERLAADGVAITVTSTTTWRSLFPYQRFVPGPQWKPFSFDVQSNDTAEQRTRLQIWCEGTGKLWLADVRLEPIGDPAEGRWREGLYLDVPEEWDDPYRFFRW